MLVDGISFIPNQGNQTQNIPPITSVNDNNVNSAAGIFLEPIEYKMRPRQTRVPCVANNASFLFVDKKFISLIESIKYEKTKQNKPANATVVNFGVSFRHLKLTENIEKPKAETNPKTRPGRVFSCKLPIDITIIPKAATIIDIHTVREIFSLKNKKPKRAVINGIDAKQSNVIAAVVLVIDHIKVIMAVASPAAPKIPDNPIFK